MKNLIIIGHPDTYDMGVDIMVEAKQKDLAILKFI
jgi:hypothetical protein